MSFWCFTCNGVVLPFYTWILGSLRNFTGVLSGFFFYLFVLLLWFLPRNVLPTLEARHVKTKHTIFRLTSASLFISHCFPITTFIIWTYSLTLSFLSQMQAIARYLSAFHYVQDENIMNLATSYIFFLKSFQITWTIILTFCLFTIYFSLIFSLYTV